MAAGAAIGFEREYRSRPAGLRTHILVSLTSAVLMLAAVHQVRWLSDTPDEMIRIDPVRMAHGILTGIGFLCGGVIFRQGLSVHGLTTAASLWVTSGLGVLYGVGFYALAVGGTVVTLLVLAGLRGFDAVMPQVNHVDVAVRLRRSQTITEAEFIARLDRFGLRAQEVTHRLLDGGEVVEIEAAAHGRGRLSTDALAADLCSDPAVVGFDLAPRA